jgi:hypothetical protein
MRDGYRRYSDDLSCAAGCSFPPHAWNGLSRPWLYCHSAEESINRRSNRARHVERLPSGEVTTWGARRFCLGPRSYTELAAVVVSLVGYFFYITAAFTLIMALLVGLLTDSALQSVHHYQRQLIVGTATVVGTVPAERNLHSHAASATKAKPVQQAANSPIIVTASPLIIAAASPQLIAAASTARVASEKTTRQKLAHVRKPKMLARARDGSSEPSYPIALGYAQDPRYGLAASSFSKLPYLIQHGHRRR